jgi:hypothetical protein
VNGPALRSILLAVTMTFLTVLAVGAVGLAFLAQSRYENVKVKQQHQVDVMYDMASLIQTQGRTIEVLLKSTRTNQQAISFLFGGRPQASPGRQLASVRP